jgi:hypothetical protein
MVVESGKCEKQQNMMSCNEILPRAEAHGNLGELGG